jgi:hypothetical protein
VSPDNGLALDEIDLLAGVRKYQRSVNSRDAATDDEHVGAALFEWLVQADATHCADQILGFFSGVVFAPAEDRPIQLVLLTQS